MSAFGETVVWQPGMTLDELEKRAILACYKFNRSNKTITAQSLGISVRTLDNKFALYNTKEEKQKFTYPTREEILEETQKHVTKTGAGGSDHRIQQLEKSNVDGDGNPVTKTGPGGRLSDSQLAELAQRKQERMALNAGKSEAAFENGVRTEDGPSEESVEEVSQKSTLPVPEREEVQMVSSEHLAANSGRSNGGNLQKGNAKPNQIHNSKQRGK